jgi:Fe-S-cluster containining protein
MKLKVISNDPGAFPCDTCDTNCCKEYTIFVNAHDIYRLSTGLKKSPESFLELFGAKDFDLGIKVQEGLLDLALKQKEGACMFLEKSKDIYRCTVNEIKPSVCKSYPFGFKNGKFIQMDDIMCPTDWDTSAFESMMSIHLKKDKDEWQFYDNLVAEWNKADGAKKSLAEFLKFSLDKVSLVIKN